ncbi:hypothetical protein PIB30_058815 [Stylosanthes scabra]|uniref:Uncharacterized protein n=1 Tax=Stylosanthes scabra TaxID=79078 RepID=A0ABU6RKX9_9FABA|nr:hypothetical protein [Stylosanthes scabra]
MNINIKVDEPVLAAAIGLPDNVNLLLEQTFIVLRVHKRIMSLAQESRWIENWGSEIRYLHFLHTHLLRISSLTGNRRRIFSSRSMFPNTASADSCLCIIDDETKEKYGDQTWCALRREENEAADVMEKEWGKTSITSGPKAQSP